MDSKIKKRWVKALRSGKYRQGQNEMLSITGAMCCLGVLCSLQDPQDAHHWTLRPVSPNILRDAAGLDTVDLNIFVEANDTHKWSFEQIADYIEGML